MGFGKKQIFLSSLLVGCLALAIGFLPACALRDYYPPGLGTSADLQGALAQSLEQNMKEIPFDPAGQVINLRVQAFGAFQRTQGLEGYVRSLFHEWIVSRGGNIGPGQLEMTVFLPMIGNSATRRDLSYWLIPLYYSERFRANSQMAVLVRDREGKIVNFWAGKRGGEDLADIFLMRMFGPFDIPSLRQ